MKHPRFFSIAAIAFLACTSCATHLVEAAYGPPTEDPTKRAIPLQDRAGEDINGFLPKEVVVKTRTQTFCRDYEFIVVDGRIYYKGRSTAKKSPKWKLLTKTGLPHATSIQFRAPRRIVEISADADTLVAFSDEGRMYQCYFEQATVTKPFTWIDRFGWPAKLPLAQNDLVADNRGWSIGVRRKDVLWYEDANGNQHHYGTMGIETIYFLTKDGQEIRYADTGLPPDFSHGILGPERGAFVARALSASGSTIFLINDAGEMYTRLADFDTLGSDPMFYTYTYRKERQPLPGSDYATNFTAWALPSEDWKKQPSIKLSGPARITDKISIHQTGRGNFARTLRVAGVSEEGATGYWEKPLAGESWAFVPSELTLGEGDFLSAGAKAGEVGGRGERTEISYDGYFAQNGNRLADVTASIPDFSPVEGDCHLVVARGAESRTIRLFPVEIWSYVTRYNPGFDGTSRYYFVTMEAPSSLLDGTTPEFRAVLEQLIEGRDLALFSCRAKGTNAWLKIDIGSTSAFLTRGGLPETDPSIFAETDLGIDPVVKRGMDPELQLADADALTIRRRSEIERVIALNKEYRATLRREIKKYAAYRGVAGLSRLGYGTFDLVATVTMLDQLEFPKFKTMTSYSGDIMTKNLEEFTYLSESKEWVYSHILDIVDVRIEAYESVINAFNRGQISAAPTPAARNSFPEYFADISLPSRVAEKGGGGASVSTLETSPLFPILMYERADAKVIIELKGAARKIAYRNGVDASAAPFSCPVAFHSFTGTLAGAAQDTRFGDGEFQWDGQTMKIWVKRGLFARKLVFEGAPSE